MTAEEWWNAFIKHRLQCEKCTQWHEEGKDLADLPCLDGWLLVTESQKPTPWRWSE